MKSVVGQVYIGAHFLRLLLERFVFADPRRGESALSCDGLDN
jgi:hypothetical protein